MDSALNSHGSSLFLPSGGGCGKTYLAKLIAAGIHARDKIVLCTASTSLTALLLPGGCTAHSQFKIPIPCHEQSTCNIKKDDDAIHELLKEILLSSGMKQPLNIILWWKQWIVLFMTCLTSSIVHLETLPFYLEETSGKPFLLSCMAQENRLFQLPSLTPIFSQIWAFTIFAKTCILAKIQNPMNKHSNFYILA